MQKFDHNIGFGKKRHFFRRKFFRRKFAKIGENFDHNIAPD
jgi:hypothetical protein